MSDWQTDNSGNRFQTPDSKPPASAGTQVSTPDGKGGIWSGGIVTPNK